MHLLRFNWSCSTMTTLSPLRRHGGFGVKNWFRLQCQICHKGRHGSPHVRKGASSSLAAHQTLCAICADLGGGKNLSSGITAKLPQRPPRGTQRFAKELQALAITSALRRPEYFFGKKAVRNRACISEIKNPTKVGLKTVLNDAERGAIILTDEP